MKISKIIISLFIINYSLLISLSAQEVGIGKWCDHLPYTKGIAVADAGNLVYCATKQGLFYYDKKEGSVHKMSKITGLSDFGFSTVAFDTISSTLIVAYSNTNIDLIKNNTI